MSKVALYARVSTSEQDPGRQLEDLRDHAAREFPDAGTEPFVDVISGTEEGEEYRRPGTPPCEWLRCRVGG